jgi:hypothetical protein
MRSEDEDRPHKKTGDEMRSEDEDRPHKKKQGMK